MPKTEAGKVLLPGFLNLLRSDRHASHAEFTSVIKRGCPEEGLQQYGGNSAVGTADAGGGPGYVYLRLPSQDCKGRVVALQAANRLIRQWNFGSWREESNPQPAVQKAILGIFHPTTLQHQYH